MAACPALSPRLVRGPVVFYRPRIEDDDGADVRTESQKEWAEWAAHGYRKLYQPRSVRRLGLVFFTAFAVAFVAVVWLAAHGRFP